MKINAFLTQCVEDGVFPGATWVVGSKDRVVDQGSVGVLGEGLGPTSLDTLYDLASLTKVIVTFALMRQFEEGKVRLLDRLDYFLPAYKGHPKGCITLFELLTHTSAIPGQLQLYRHAHTREDLLEAIRWQVPRVDSPKSVFYTSKGFILLGEVISTVDGKPLDEVVHERVLSPLGMYSTFYNPSPSLLDRIAPTEYCTWRKQIVRGQVHDENAVIMGGVSGHAGLFSTAQDVAIAARNMLTGEESWDNRLFSNETIRIMTVNHTHGKGENRGLGFQIAGPDNAAGDLMSESSFGHTGFTGTSLWICPIKGLYAVLLSNRIHPNRNNEGIFRARQVFHNMVILNYSKCIA